MKKIISFVLSVVIFTSIIPNYGCNPENNIYSHKGYFLEYKQIELLKQEKHLI